MDFKKHNLCVLVTLMSQPLMAMNALQDKQVAVALEQESAEWNKQKIRQAKKSPTIPDEPLEYIYYKDVDTEHKNIQKLKELNFQLQAVSLSPKQKADLLKQRSDLIAETQKLIDKSEYFKKNCHVYVDVGMGNSYEHTTKAMLEEFELLKEFKQDEKQDMRKAVKEAVEAMEEIKEVNYRIGDLLGATNLWAKDSEQGKSLSDSLGLYRGKRAQIIVRVKQTLNENIFLKKEDYTVNVTYGHGDTRTYNSKEVRETINVAINEDIKPIRQANKVAEGQEEKNILEAIEKKEEIEKVNHEIAKCLADIEDYKDTNSYWANEQAQKLKKLQNERPQLINEIKNMLKNNAFLQKPDDMMRVVRGHGNSLDYSSKEMREGLETAIKWKMVREPKKNIDEYL